MTQEFQDRYITARRAVIARRYKKLNPQQLEAALATEGALLLLAGAGSGKTTVLIQRVDNLLTFGRGSDTAFVPPEASEADLAFLESFTPSPENWERARQLCAVDPATPWSILAITFTNKAAEELKERLEKTCGAAAAGGIWAATFHSACVRILRRDIDLLGLGYTSSFTIYDADDSRRMIRDIVRDLNLDEKSYQPKSVLTAISHAKEEDCSPKQLAARAGADEDWRFPRIVDIYTAYERRLQEANALDFDDIIRLTVHLLQANEETLRYYQHKFRYVLIDEYQDTNYLQDLLARLLAGGSGNICVVGDDDQSIYRFRGANVENILNFEKRYNGCRTIRLEQNYRSTQHILDAANEVIRHNIGRKGKNLWTKSGAGELVHVRSVFDESEEAQFVADQILGSFRQGNLWHDSAVLYRMNAQSNAIEMALKRNGIPYKVFGGMKFFDRAEVRDMLAYLCVVNNPNDDLRLRRIVNVPIRGIGDTTVDKVAQIARQEGKSLYAALREAGKYPELRLPIAKLKAFISLIEDLQRAASVMELPDFYDYLCQKSGYLDSLEGKNDMESRGRAENVRELRSSIVGFLAMDPADPSLAGFLDSVALYTDIDDAGKGDDCVSLMTIHSAKGLEFSSVYIVGMEEGIFPSSRSMEAEDLEEERRLCYVAMTRAKTHLTLLCANQRMLYGHTSANNPSRFLNELPASSVAREDPAQQNAPASPVAFPPARAAGDRGTETARAVGSTFNSVRRMQRSRVPRSIDKGFTYPVKAPVEPSSLHLNKGDRVKHSTFGEGMVLNVRPMGNDALLEVAFQEVGTKKLMFRVAGQHMKKL